MASSDANFLQDIKTISQFVDEIGEKYGNQVAFEIRRRVIKEKVHYQDLPLMVRKVSKFLDENGLSEKDKILIWGMNCPEYAVLLLTLFSTGRTAVPVDFRTKDETIEKVMQQTSPSAAFTSRFLRSEKISGLKKTFYLEDLFSLIKDIKVSKTKLVKSNNTLCEIVYTSGTTGTPKGVLISENNILTNLQSIYQVAPTLSELRTISILPLSHMLEQIVGLLYGLAVGSKITYLTRINSTRLKNEFLETHPTYLLFVPQMLSLFWDKIESGATQKGKTDSLKKALKFAPFLPQPVRKILFSAIHKEFGGKLELVFSGGAPLNILTADKFRHLGFKIIQGYGATELTAVATFNGNPNSLRNVGKPIPGIELKIDTDGQILVKSPSISAGYYNNPDKTNEVFIDGWYKTGDIGRLNASGKLEIIGRDFFKIVLENGEKVYVEDLENKINSDPRVRDSCVIGIKNGQSDKIHTVVLLKNQQDEPRMGEIIKEINGTLESKQQIFSFSTWQSEDFPRTPTLKIDRKLVQQLIVENHGKDSHPEKNLSMAPDHVDLLSIISQISKVERGKILDSDVLTSDLGMDSIDRGELSASIEENMGLYVDELQINSRTTVADMKKLITQASKQSDQGKFSTWQFGKTIELIRFFLQTLIIFPLHGIFARIEVANPENLKNLTPKTIIIFNHAGILDMICIYRLIGKNANKIIMPGYAGFWNNKTVGRLIELFGGSVPLKQTGANLLPFLQQISDLVDGGRFLFLAPQQRLQKQGQQDKFKLGIGYFAQELQLPVLPIKLIGYEEIWPSPKYDIAHLTNFREALPKKRGTVTLKIGSKVDVSKLKSPVEAAHLIEEEFLRL